MMCLSSFLISVMEEYLENLLSVINFSNISSVTFEMSSSDLKSSSRKS